jgi:predicted component of type VI protein secretion system
MGKLIITESGGATRELLLEQERVSIGRHADNDICLNDKAVSGHHAVIITIQSDSFLEDLDSTNGTLVNQRQIAKHALNHGDVISIGRNELRYESVRSAPQARFETSASSASLTPAPAATTSTTTAADTAGSGRLRLENGPNAGRELELTKTLTTFGKPGVQLVAISRRADGFFIVDAGSAPNGPRPQLNGQPLGTTIQPLQANDLIELGGIRMRFQLG